MTQPASHSSDMSRDNNPSRAGPANSSTWSFFRGGRASPATPSSSTQSPAPFTAAQATPAQTGSSSSPSQFRSSARDDRDLQVGQSRWQQEEQQSAFSDRSWTDYPSSRLLEEPAEAVSSASLQPLDGDSEGVTPSGRVAHDVMQLLVEDAQPSSGERPPSKPRVTSENDTNSLERLEASAPSSAVAGIARGGNSEEQAGLTPSSQEPQNQTLAAEALPASHLHSLTERKLEKAVLGRAVGLRQLVLMSNAFASRLTAAPPAPSSRLQQASTSSFESAYEVEVEEQEVEAYDFYDEPYDSRLSAQDLLLEEDEAERKRREEDWLDSVLDEMLTDADDDEAEEAYRDQPLFATCHAPTTTDPRWPHEREFREPYVHLSIKYPSTALDNTSNQASSILPAASPVTSAQLAVHDPASDLPAAGESLLSNSELVIPHLVSDSGYLEPAQIPLPDSPDSSSRGSASSKSEDDEYPEDAEPDSKECCTESGRNPFHGQAVQSQPSLAMPATPAAIPIATTGPSSPCCFAATSLPDLAYSVTSLNTAFSSSPSHSINLPTPGTSPALQSGFSLTRRKSNDEDGSGIEGTPVGLDYYTAQREGLDVYELHCSTPEETALPIDDLDDLWLEDNQDGRPFAGQDKDSSEEGDGDSAASTTRGENMTSTKSSSRSSLELVPYSATSLALGCEAQDVSPAAPRRPNYGLFSLPASQTYTPHLSTLQVPVPPISKQPVLTYPNLPPSLLSLMMDNTSLFKCQLPTAGASAEQPALGPSASHCRTGPGDGTRRSTSPEKLRLPMFLPSEIVKSLYDSVDFGLPSRFSSPSSSPRTTPAHSPTMSFLPNLSTVPDFADFESGGSTKAKHRYGTQTGAIQAASAPASPRSRSKSIGELDSKTSTFSHAPASGLLFSSLGLFGVSQTSSAQYLRNSDDVDLEVPSTYGLSHQAMPFFGKNIVHDWERRRGSSAGASATSSASARNESRSPSRLRLHLEHEDAIGDDFDFGII